MTANPGSKEARAAGCICLRRENEYGRGDFDLRDKDGKRLFWIAVNCPIHAEFLRRDERMALGRAAKP